MGASGPPSTIAGVAVLGQMVQGQAEASRAPNSRKRNVSKTLTFIAIFSRTFLNSSPSLCSKLLRGIAEQFSFSFRQRDRKRDAHKKRRVVRPAFRLLISLNAGRTTRRFLCASRFRSLCRNEKENCSAIPRRSFEHSDGDELRKVREKIAMKVKVLLTFLFLL